MTRCFARVPDAARLRAELLYQHFVSGQQVALRFLALLIQGQRVAESDVRDRNFGVSGWKTFGETLLCFAIASVRRRRIRREHR